MASAENRFRKIEIRMWRDRKFRELSPLLPSGQSLWIYLLTGPHTGIIPGVFAARRGGLAEELGWAPEAFDAAFGEIASRQMAEADWRAGVVWIPNAIKCNPPQSPNVITAWRKEWSLIPDCDLKTKAYEAMQSAADVTGKAYRDRFNREFVEPSSKAFVEPLPKAMANQEQEQEQLTGTGNRKTPHGASALLEIDLVEKTKPNATASSSAIPDWIPAEPWAGFVEVRKRLRKPMTDRAAGIIIAKLAELRTQGEDVGAVLDQSTENGWKSVFPVKRDRATLAGEPAPIVFKKATKQTPDGQQCTSPILRMNWQLVADPEDPELTIEKLYELKKLTITPEMAREIAEVRAVRKALQTA